MPKLVLDEVACICAGSGLSSSAAFTCSASLAILGIFGIDVQKLVSALHDTTYALNWSLIR